MNPIYYLRSTDGAIMVRISEHQYVSLAWAVKNLGAQDLSPAEKEIVRVNGRFPFNLRERAES